MQVRQDGSRMTIRDEFLSGLPLEARKRLMTEPDDGLVEITIQQGRGFGKDSHDLTQSPLHLR